MPEETAMENILAGQTLRAPVSFVDCILRTPRLRKSERAGRAGALALLEKLDLRRYADVRVGSFPTAR